MELSRLLKILEGQRQHEQDIEALKKQLQKKPPTTEEKAPAKSSELEESSEELIPEEPQQVTETSSENLEERTTRPLTETSSRNYSQPSEEAPSTTTYRKSGIAEQYSVMTSPTIEHLANTFIKEGLITPDQAVTPDQKEAMLKRLRELNPGASTEKILSEHQALTHTRKKEGSNGNIR